MTGKGTGGKLPWGSSSAGVYGARRSNTGRTVLLGLIALAAVALVVFLVMRACGGGAECGADDFYCATSEDIPAPEGYARVSKVYALNEAAGDVGANNLNVTLPLEQSFEDGRNLSFYRYVQESNTWQPLAQAVLDARGDRATATFNSTPPQIAVLQRLSAAGHVVAYLPAGSKLHPDALGNVTLVHTLDYRPASDGTITGSPTPLQSNGTFAIYPSISAGASDRSDITVATILSSAATRSAHVQNIVKLTNDGNFAGIDLAYSDLQPDQRAPFTLFVAELAQALHRQNKQLTLTLPPPLWATDHADEGAYDWKGLAASADLVQMSPIRDQSRYRSDTPRILDYLASVVDPAKLVMIVTPYATEKTPEGLRTMSITDAMTIATQLAVRGATDSTIASASNVEVVGVNIDRTENLAGVVWDDQTATVAFAYKFNGPRTVWLENFFSVGFKLEMLAQHKLGGVGIEDASDNIFLGNIWPAIATFTASGQPDLLQPNPNDLRPVWTVSGGDKEGGDRAGANGVLKWVTPSQPGSYTVALTLSDGVSYFENEIAVNVEARAPAAGSPTPSR